MYEKYLSTSLNGLNSLSTYLRVPAAEGSGIPSGLTGGPIAPPLCSFMLSMLARAVLVFGFTCKAHKQSKICLTLLLKAFYKPVLGGS